MKQKELKLIRELILNGKRSDRDLAKDIHATQPTVGRIRKKIEKENYISEYTVIPNLSTLDIDLIAVIAIRWKDYKKIEKLKKFEEFIRKSKFVFFSAPGEGFQGKTKIMITFHKDYKAYELFLRGIRANWIALIDEMDVFLVSTDNIIKNFSFSGLASMLSGVKG